jgi:hypothetical protein
MALDDRLVASRCGARAPGRLAQQGKVPMPARTHHAGKLPPTPLVRGGD